MSWGKYIIVEERGHEVAIMFDSLLSHIDIANNIDVISAGFFAVGAKPSEKDPADISVSVFGNSTTLKKKSRETDSRLLKKILRPN